MKLKIHCMLLSLIIVTTISVYSFPAMATDVGGIIDTDTTWDLAGSPYNVTSDIQVAEGIILTIMPGVVVNGRSDNNGDIFLWGIINAVGNETSRIIWNNVEVYIKGYQNVHVNIQFSDIYSGSPFMLDNGSGSLNLTDSKIQNSYRISVAPGNPGDNCNIERNIFENSDPLFVDPNTNGDTIIKNNVFFGTELNIRNCANPTTETIVEYNSFLSTDTIALRLYRAGCGIAINNYWNTTNTNIIDSMIYDRNDDLSVYNYVQYVPFLTSPHPDTPIPDFNQTPIADCGEDMIVVFDAVTLDGSASYDPDGFIDLYEWKLEYIGDPTHDETAVGENPTIIDLHPGVYNA
jgi:hypothetical protein